MCCWMLTNLGVTGWLWVLGSRGRIYTLVRWWWVPGSGETGVQVYRQPVPWLTRPGHQPGHRTLQSMASTFTPNLSSVMFTSNNIKNIYSVYSLFLHMHHFTFLQLLFIINITWTMNMTEIKVKLKWFSSIGSWQGKDKPFMSIHNIDIT